MKALLLLLFIHLSIITAPCKSTEINLEPELDTVLNVDNADHLLLVGFPDQSINRPLGASPSTYRRRGNYQSSGWSKRISQQIAEDYHIEKLTEWPMSEIGVHCIVYQVPLNASVSDTMQRLSQNTDISIVQNMHLFKTKAHATNDPYFKLQTNLRDMQIGEAHSKATGKGINIAMIDTGVDLTHPDLMGQIAQHENFSTEISPDFSNDQHGTAIAGIMVAKKDNETGIIGIAPDAKLIAYKACWPSNPNSMEAVCNSYTLSLAVNSAIKSGAKILNISLGGPRDEFLEKLLNKAIENGMIVVAADEDQDAKDVSFPASLKDVLSIQSIKKPDAARTHKAKSLSAPGEKILTTLPYGTYDFITGSSIATAEVSGIIALLMQIKPDLTFSEARTLLQQSQLPSKESSFTGINANTALAILCKTADCS
jgi:subtilisin family serine protease